MDIFTPEQATETLLICAAQPCGVHGYSNLGAPAENLFLPMLDETGMDAIAIFASINPAVADRVPRERLFEVRWFNIGAGEPGEGQPFHGL